MRKPAYCICICAFFLHTDGTIPQLPKPKISSLKLSSVAAQVCVGPAEKPRRPVFSRYSSYL